MSVPVFLELPGLVPIPLTAELVPYLEATLRTYRRSLTGSRDLARDIQSFLLVHPGSRTIEIARGISARDTNVRDTLESDRRFQRACTPPCRTGRAKYWEWAVSESEPVPRSGTTRAGTAPPNGHEGLSTVVER